METKEEVQILAEPFQYKFLNSRVRYPALVSGVGTGKTYFMLLKIWSFCITHPDTLALIVRKEFTDLRDSTIKDFEKYFNVILDSKKEYKFNNGSIIMFRHGGELNVLKNINLTIFGMEQAEEFDSEEAFIFLRDRLRRNNAPYRQGVIIGNVKGDNWIKKFWKDGKLAESELIEASTFENSHNLPEDFLEDLKRMEKEAPAHYKQYVLNDWSISDLEFVLIKAQSLEPLKSLEHHYPQVKRIISCDPSTGGDECCIYVIENYEIIDSLFMHENDTMKIAGEIMVLGNKWEVNDFAIDSIGIGKGIADRLYEMVKPEGKSVYSVNSAEEASDKEHFLNKRIEMWWTVMQLILDKKIAYPQDEELRRQLTNACYEVMNSKGKVKMEDKAKTKKRIFRSPDRADTFIYGMYYMQYVDPKKKKISNLDGYKLPDKPGDKELSLVNY